ncbi:unnamed protein product [Boreogadus saida]
MPEAHKRKRIDNMNVVDHLLEHRFETLSLEEKLELFSLISPLGHCLGLWEVYSMYLPAVLAGPCGWRAE